MRSRWKTLIFLSFTEKSDCREEGSRKTNIEGGLSKKRRAWTVCRFKRRGGVGKNEGSGVFEGVWYPNARYENFNGGWSKFQKVQGTFYLLFAQDLKKQIICDTKQYFLKHLLEKQNASHLLIFCIFFSKTFPEYLATWKKKCCI